MRRSSLLFLASDPHLAGAIDLCLSARGFDVTTVATAAEAMPRLATQWFDAIVVDARADVHPATRLRAACDAPLVGLVMAGRLDPAFDVTVGWPSHPQALAKAIRLAIRLHEEKRTRRVRERTADSTLSSDAIL